MYCGDETGSFVGDVGSHTSRFGYGGEDCPKYVVPSYVARNKSPDDRARRSPVPNAPHHPRWAEAELASALRQARTDDNSHQPLVDPVAYLAQGDSVQDWDAYEQLWQSAFDVMHVRERYKHTKGGGNVRKEKNSNSIIASDNTAIGASGVTSTTIRDTISQDSRIVHPVLASTPGCTYSVGVGAKAMASARRRDLVHRVECLMESLDCPAAFLAPTPMLSAFAYGRQTALVVDVGAGGCIATPVVDGLLLTQAQRRNGRGGDWLGNVTWQALLEQRTIVRPRYQQHASFKPDESAAKNGIFHRWAMQDLMYEFRTSGNVAVPAWWYDETVPFCKNPATEAGDEMVVDPISPGGSESITYELPDGTLVDLTNRVGRDLCRVPELLFTDQVPFVSADQISNSSVLMEHESLTNLPLHKLVHESLAAVGDVDVRKDLAANIVLTGASSLLPNMEQRLSLETSRMTSSAYKCKVLASRHAVERSCAAWIGGSILSSLGSFQQLWLSRTEYEEYGATLAIQRFP